MNTRSSILTIAALAILSLSALAPTQASAWGGGHFGGGHFGGFDGYHGYGGARSGCGAISAPDAGRRDPRAV
jgi:hypothetical protein